LAQYVEHWINNLELTRSTRPISCHALTLNKSFTHMCLCSPSSVN